MAKKKHPDFYFCELWRVNYYFYIGWDVKEFEDYVEKKEGVRPQSPGVGKCFCVEREGGSAIIHIWVKKKTDYPTLAHECLHASNWTLGRAGWEPQLWNDEPQTYLMTNLMRQALGRNI